MNKSVGIMLLFFSLWAYPSRATNKEPDPKPPSPEDFRCERFPGAGVGSLKAKLIEFCDLEKPFSFTEGGVSLSKTTYTYCCHVK